VHFWACLFGCGVVPHLITLHGSSWFACFAKVISFNMFYMFCIFSLHTSCMFQLCPLIMNMKAMTWFNLSFNFIKRLKCVIGPWTYNMIHTNVRHVYDFKHTLYVCVNEILEFIYTMYKCKPFIHICVSTLNLLCE
jgi:hypothetical protein